MLAGRYQVPLFSCLLDFRLLLIIFANDFRIKMKKKCELGGICLVPLSDMNQNVSYALISTSGVRAKYHTLVKYIA